MYVNPFWLGVLVTVLVEMVGIILIAVAQSIKKK